METCYLELFAWLEGQLTSARRLTCIDLYVESHCLGHVQNIKGTLT